MRIFISGGCKNGKSYHALKLTARMGGPLYYIATMVSGDAEDDERIDRHRAERAGFMFTTVEQPKHIDRLPDFCDVNGSYLLDSVTALLANEMFDGGKIYPDAYKTVERDILSLIRKIPNIVIVSDYIYSDAAIYDEWTERYRSGLAHIDRAAAKACDAVFEAAYGELLVHKDEKGCYASYEKII